MLRLFVLWLRNWKLRNAVNAAVDASRTPATPRRNVIEEMESRTMLAGNGLAATYFNNPDFTGTTVSRVDAKVDFNWGAGSPASAIGVDTYSARWTGSVVPTKTENYTFYTTSDDGVRVWVNNQLVINNWTEHAPTENRGTVALEAGKQYAIRVEYFEKRYGAVMKLSWSSASTPKQVIPQSQLYSTAPANAPASSGPIAVGGTGNGLLATYWDNNNFTGTAVTRTDPTVNFNWGSGGPAGGIGADTFSARWTGQVLAQKTEEYTFYTQSDDGVRLWVNGQLLDNNWTTHASTENRGRIRLEAGKRYDVKLEYYEQTAGAVMQLKWSSATTPKQVIPQSQLFAATAVTPPSSTPVPTTPTTTPTTTTPPPSETARSAG